MQGLEQDYKCAMIALMHDTYVFTPLHPQL